MSVNGRDICSKKCAKQYADKVDFVQTVKVKPGIKTNLSGSIEIMICNNKECLPPAKQEFSIALK